MEEPPVSIALRKQTPEENLKVQGSFSKPTLQYSVPADLSVAEGHDSAESARRAILRQLPHLSNVVIHVDPLDSSGETLHHQA